MDVSDLSDTLQRLNTDEGSEQSLSELCLNHLRSNDPNVQQSIVYTLYAWVNDMTTSHQSDRRDLIFADHGLDYIPVLFASPPEAQERALDLVLTCSQHCSPREAILALGEACSGIEERFFGCVVSDDEEMELDDGREEQGTAGEMDDAQLAVPAQMKTLFMALAISFSRMPNIKSTPTLLTIADVLESALIHMSSTCASAGDDNIAGAALEMIEQAWAWVQRSIDVGGEQRAILSQLFYLSTSLLSPQAHDSLRRWFSAKYPKYAAIRTQSTGVMDIHTDSTDHILARAIRTASKSNLDTQTFVDNIAGASVGSRVSPHASFASLILIAHLLASDAADPPQTTNGQPQTIQLPPLGDTLTLLSAALGSTAIDAGLTFLFELVLRMKIGTLAADEAEQLVEILFPIAATHPDPLIRMAVWKLVCEMVHKVSEVQGQIRLLRQLLEPANPFIQIRLQALVLLRQELSDAARRPDRTDSLLSSRIWDLPLIRTQDEIDPDDPFGPYTAYLTEVLVMLRFICEVDEGNRTGILGGSIEQDIRVHEMCRAKSALREMKKALPAGPTSEEVIDPGQDALLVMGEGFVAERLEEAIEALETALRG